MDFYRCSIGDIGAFGKGILQESRRSAGTFGAASQMICQRIVEGICLNDGSPLFALFRIFRIGHMGDLPPGIHPSTKDVGDYWVMLAGTYGIEAQWCDRAHSVDHRAFPEQEALKRPMFAEGFRQLGLAWGERAYDSLSAQSDGMYQYFHVVDASQGDVIPDVDVFVNPYGICSALGFGSAFLSKAAFLALGFARAPISTEDAEKIAAMSPHIATALAGHDKHPLWQ